MVCSSAPAIWLPMGSFCAVGQLQMGGVSGPMLPLAVFFALESAILAVLLEWFFPIRKLENGE